MIYLKIWLIVNALLLSAILCRADEAKEKALADRALNELNAGLSCSAELYRKQAKIEELEAKLKDKEKE